MCYTDLIVKVTIQKVLTSNAVMQNNACNYQQYN